MGHKGFRSGGHHGQGKHGGGQKHRQSGHGHGQESRGHGLRGILSSGSSDHGGGHGRHGSSRFSLRGLLARIFR